MSKKEQYIKSAKEVRTIKVKTLVIALVWAASLLMVSIATWIARSNFDATIRAQVNEQVEAINKASKNVQ